MELGDFYFILVGVALTELKYGCIVRMYSHGDERKQKRTVTHSSKARKKVRDGYKVLAWVTH